MYTGSTQSQNLLIDGKITPIIIIITIIITIIIIIIQTQYKMQEWTKQSIRNIQFETYHQMKQEKKKENNKKKKQQH